MFFNSSLISLTNATIKMYDPSPRDSTAAKNVNAYAAMIYCIDTATKYPNGFLLSNGYLNLTPQND